MELDRKAFHFDLDNKSVERFYTGKKNPWSDIQDFRWFQPVPVPTHSLGLEELDFFGSEIGDMKSATAELSKRNGLEPPKDLNNEH